MFKKRASEEEPEPAVKKDWLEEMYEWIETFVWVPVAVVLLFSFVGRTSVVSGESMLETLHDGDMLIVSNAFYNPDAGDIVVLTKPTYHGGVDPIVKRVIATEGQRVDIDFIRGVVSVDGVELSEPYTATPTNLQYDTEFPITIQPGHIFVMGDNRNGSLDSRDSSIGQVDKRLLMGRAYFRIFPFDDAERLTDN